MVFSLTGPTWYFSPYMCLTCMERRSEACSSDAPCTSPPASNLLGGVYELVVIGPLVCPSSHEADEIWLPILLTASTG